MLLLIILLLTPVPVDSENLITAPITPVAASSTDALATVADAENETAAATTTNSFVSNETDTVERENVQSAGGFPPVVTDDSQEGASDNTKAAIVGDAKVGHHARKVIAITIFSCLIYLNLNKIVINF